MICGVSESEPTMDSGANMTRSIKFYQRWFRRYLPEYIGFQYYIAVMIHLEGCDSIPAIETRPKYKNALPGWSLLPGYVPTVMHDVC